jgi:hypothetical protein
MTHFELDFTDYYYKLYIQRLENFGFSEYLEKSF